MKRHRSDRLRRGHAVSPRLFDRFRAAYGELCKVQAAGREDTAAQLGCQRAIEAITAEAASLLRGLQRRYGDPPGWDTPEVQQAHGQLAARYQALIDAPSEENIDRLERTVNDYLCASRRAISTAAQARSRRATRRR